MHANRWMVVPWIVGFFALAGCRGAGDAAERAGAGAGATSATVSGSVQHRERIALPPDTALLVTLEDVSRADAPAAVLASRTIPTAGREVPIPFELSYDPTLIDPSHRYVVRAEIQRASGAPMFRTARAYPVLTHGAPASVDVVVEMVGEPDAASPAPLLETRWSVESIDGEEVVAGTGREEPHLIFQSEEQRLVGSTGVNRLSGTYALPAGEHGREIELRPAGMTMLAGPENLMQQEKRLIARMQQVDRFRLEGRSLTLYSGDREVLGLRAADPR